MQNMKKIWKRKGECTLTYLDLWNVVESNEWFLMLLLFYKLHLNGLFIHVWGFSSHWRIFLSFGDVTIYGEGLCSALLQWEFFNVPHQLWHRPILYNGQLRRPVTLMPVAEHLVVELSQPVSTWLNPDHGGERSTNSPYLNDFCFWIPIPLFTDWNIVVYFILAM